MLCRLARLALVLVLVSGWTAGLLHPLQHTDEAGALVHLAGGGKPAGATTDKLCDVLGGLACLASHAATGGPDVASLRVPFASAAVAGGGEPPPFLAQGPPSLL